MHVSIKNAGDFSAHSKAKRHKTWLVALSCVLGIGIGISLLESSNPGLIAGVLSVIRDLLVAIWRMICDIADACSGFIDYILHTRSS